MVEAEPRRASSDGSEPNWDKAWLFTIFYLSDGSFKDVAYKSATLEMIYDKGDGCVQFPQLVCGR